MTNLSQTPGAVLRRGLAAAAVRPAVCYGTAISVAICFFFLTYADPLAFLSGDSGFFEVGDAPQHVTGWLLYAQDIWRWPLLETQLIDPPRGANIAFTDSIPLAALFFKAFEPWLPAQFHYFGLWHMLAKGIQATGAVFLIRSLGHRGIVPAVAAAAMALLWPPALLRLTHAALTTHGLLLFALGTYFRALRQQWSVAASTTVFALLGVISLLVHPYFLAMVLPIGLALAGDRWRAGHKLSGSIVIAGLSVAVVGSALLLLGYAAPGSSEDPGGFQHFSMNLLSPFCGGVLSPCSVPDATGGQGFEGFNYLGAGTLVLGLVAIPLLACTGVAAYVRRYLVLVLLMAGFAAYSLSDRIFLGSSELAFYRLPPVYLELSEVFRASGRFFWPVGYACLFAALALVLRQRLLIAVPVLAAAIGLQWIDTGALRSNITATTAPDRPFDYSGWSDLGPGIQHIQLSPTYGCGEIDNMHYLYFQIVAARLGVSINTGYFARSADKCRVVEDTSIVPNILYVSLDPVRNLPVAPIFQQAMQAGHCARWPQWKGVVFCLMGTSQAEWQRISPDLLVR
jgi:hypothetical protein